MYQIFPKAAHIYLSLSSEEHYQLNTLSYRGPVGTEAAAEPAGTEDQPPQQEEDEGEVRN